MLRNRNIPRRVDYRLVYNKNTRLHNKKKMEEKVIKTILTPEESKRLIELGVGSKMASMCMLYFAESDTSEPIPSWEVWEDCGKLLCNISDEVENVECKIVPIDSDYDQSSKEETPIFSIADILSILPKEIIADTIMGEDFPCALTIRWDENRKVWNCAYECLPLPLNVGKSPELIDALYSLLIWYLENTIKLKED